MVKKVYCKTCKLCSDVDELRTVGCDAYCILKERPQYKKYMKEEEKRLSTINPVTGKENSECPTRHFYYQDFSYSDGPVRYVLCSVRNKNFNCKHYKKTDIEIYLRDFRCPYCDTILNAHNGDGFKCWSYYKDHNNSEYVLDCNKCGSTVYLNAKFKIVDFWGEYNWDTKWIDGNTADNSKAIKKTMEVYEKLGITIPLSKKFSEFKKETSIKRGFWERVLG